MNCTYVDVYAFARVYMWPFVLGVNCTFHVLFAGWSKSMHPIGVAVFTLGNYRLVA